MHKFNFRGMHANTENPLFRRGGRAFRKSDRKTDFGAFFAAPEDLPVSVMSSGWRGMRGELRSGRKKQKEELRSSDVCASH